MSTVGVQKCTGNVHNFFASPAQYQTRFFCNNRYAYCFQILFIGIFQELIHVFRIYNNCHTLLRLRDCDLRTVKTGILFRNFIQIYFQTCCKLSDRYRYTACTKVITFLDQPAHFFTAEHTLNLTLCRSISLLDLSAADLNGSFRMNFGRTCCTADTVTSGTSSKEDNDIARIGILTDDCASWSCTHDSTDFHTLCHIVRMIDFFYISGSQSDLIAVRTVTVGCAANQLLLRQFAVKRLFYGNRRIGCTGHTHCLIYIGTSGKRITDCTAKTGSRTTKRLNLRRMVMSFVLKVDQPLFFHTVHINRNNDGAGINLIRLFLILQLAFCF